LSDVIFKGKGLLRNDMEGLTNASEHPSFFSVSMGMGFGSKELDFEAFDNGDPIKLEFQTSTAVQAEGAYFINKYVGLGGRLRVKTSPIKGWEDFMGMAENDAKEAMDDIKDIEKEFKHDGIVGGSLDDMLQDKEFTI
jgi:hypothetical protein